MAGVDVDGEINGEVAIGDGGAVADIDDIDGAGAGTFDPCIIAPPAHKLSIGQRRMDGEVDILSKSTIGISYIERSILSLRLLRVRGPERCLLYGVIRIFWDELQSAIDRFLVGGLHAPPDLVLSLAPVRAWPRWMPVERSLPIVSDDSCVFWYGN